MNINNRRFPQIPIKLPDTLPAEALVFPLLCGYHTYQDYKKAPQETKKQTLVMRSFVLLGTSVGILSGYKTFEKLLAKNTHINQIKKDAISFIGVPLGGIVGGFLSGSLAEGFCSFVLPPSHKKHQEFKNSKKEEKGEKNSSSILKQIGTIIFTITGAALSNVGYMNYAKTKQYKGAQLTSHAQKAINLIAVAAGAFAGLITGDLLLNKEQSDFNKKTIESTDFLLTQMTSSVSAFDSVSENKFENRIQKGFYEVISSIVVPSAIVLPTLYYLRNFTKNDAAFDKHFGFLRHFSTNRLTQKMIFEKSISIPLAVGTYFAGNYIGNLVDQKITKKIMEKDLWKTLEKQKQKALKDSQDGLAEKDLVKLQKALDDLSKIEKITQEAKSHYSEN